MTLRLLLLVFVFATSAWASCLPDPHPLDPSREPIRVGYGNWLSAELNANVLKVIIEEGFGHPVELELLEPIPNVDALKNGVDVIFEMWATGYPDVAAQLEDPIFNSVTLAGFEGRDGWYVPDYLLEFNPDFANWRSLLTIDNLQYIRPDFSGNLTESKNIYQKIKIQTDLVLNAPNTTSPEDLAAMQAELSSLVDSLQTGHSNEIDPSLFGELITLDPTNNWPTADAYLIEELGLPLNITMVPDPAETHLVAQVIEMYSQRKPFLIFLYTPMHIFDPRSGVNLHRMQLLDWKEECEDFVPRPQCVYPADNIKSGTSTSLPRKSIPVSEFMLGFQHKSTMDVNAMMADLNFDNMTHEQAACKYVLQNRAYIESFFPPPQEIVVLDWDSSMGIGLTVVASLLIAISLVMGIFLNYHKKNPVVMASSLRFCNAIIIGSILGYAAIYSFLGRPTNASCVFRPILLSLSFGIMYSYLLMKNFRIWRIFAKPFAASNKFLNDNNLLLAGSGTIFIEVLILVIWFAVDFPKPSFTETATEVVLSCQSTNPAFGTGLSWALFSFNCILVVLGLFLAIETRRVSSKFRESTFIGLATYNIILLAVVFIPFIVVEDLTNSMNKMVILCVLIILVPFLTVATLFIPKTLYIIKPELAPSYDNSNEQGTSSFRDRPSRSSNKFPAPKQHKGSSAVDQKGNSEMKSEQMMSEPPKDEEGITEVNMDILNQGLSAMKTGDYGAGY